MPDIKETIGSAIDALPKFRPGVFFLPEMDSLIFLKEDEDYRADRVDQILTLLWHPTEPKLVGIKLKGFRWIYQHLLEVGAIAENNFLTIVAVLDGAFLVAAYASENEGASIDRQKRGDGYRQARSFAGDKRRIPKKVLQATDSRLAA